MLPGAGMNPKQLKQMQRAMKQMGMDHKGRQRSYRGCH